jgi:hypothetical protein
MPFTHLMFDGPIATISLDHPQGTAGVCCEGESQEDTAACTET